MRSFRFVWLLALLLPASFQLPASAQSEQQDSKSQQVLAAAAAEQKYTFLVFFKDNGRATKAMVDTVRRALESRADQAVLTYIQVTDPAERALVDRFDVSRAPMPLTVAVAPNGAMTGLHSQKISEEQIEESFVTPGMAHCMKAMQDNKLLFVCVQRTDEAIIPPGVTDFCNDPEFKQRSAVMVVQKDDAQEVELLRQMEIDPGTKGTTVVLLAPPAVLVGKFSFAATKEEIAAALHEAGKCCDDPNCKHNHGGQKASTKSSATRANARQRASSSRRKP